MKKEALFFTHLKDYIIYLKEHHLEEFVKKDLERSFEVNLPLLAYFKHLSKEELFALTKKGILEYFNNIIEGRAADVVLQSMQDWKDDKLQGIGRNDVVASDISLIYSTRKHSLFLFLPRYTSDLGKALSIVVEVENFYTFQESLAISTFAEIKNDEISKTKTLLLETQSIANVGSFEWDIANDKSIVTPEVKKIFGYDDSDPLNFDQFGKLLHSDDEKKVSASLEHALKTGDAYLAEYRIYRKSDHALRYLWTKGKVFFDTDHHPIKLIGIIQDITERKKAEELIKHNEGLLQEAQALAHLGSWEWDVPLNLVSWSDEMYRIYGYAPGEIEMNFETYMNHIYVEDRDLVTKAVNLCYTEGIPYTFEARIYTKEGEVKWLHAKGQVTSRMNGAIQKLGGTAMDITEQKIAADALQKKSEALIASNKELEAFCYSVSHDLRSPLRAIDGFGRKLGSSYEAALDKEGQRLLHVIRSNAQQMGVLIDSLLEFSRLNRKEIKQATVDMDSLVKTVIREQQEQDPESSALFEMGNLYQVLGDRDLIHQVLQNLISNAIKFSSKRDAPIIEIGSAKKGDDITFFVKDNGAGFEMEYIDKLFGVFQRLHSTEEFSGTGVGLATVQRIIHRHGGQVWAEGKPGVGATFYFSLPAAT